MLGTCSNKYFKTSIDLDLTAKNTGVKPFCDAVHGVNISTEHSAFHLS